MGVGCFYFSSGGFVGPGGGEGNRAGFLCGFLFKQPFRVDAPSNRYHIENIFAKEEEVIGKGDHREQIVGERIYQKTVQNQQKIDQRENPGFNRDDIQKQELCKRAE